VKDEEEFRHTLQRRLKADATTWYMSSMNRVGVPDLFVAYRGVGIWIELKYVTELPKRASSNVLKKHNVTGPQRSFLRRAWKQKLPAFVVIGHGTDVYTVAPQALQEDGGITLATLQSHRSIDLSSPSFAAAFLAVAGARA